MVATQSKGSTQSNHSSNQSGTKLLPLQLCLIIDCTHTIKDMYYNCIEREMLDLVKMWIQTSIVEKSEISVIQYRDYPPNSTRLINTTPFCPYYNLNNLLNRLDFNGETSKSAMVEGVASGLNLKWKDNYKKVCLVVGGGDDNSGCTQPGEYFKKNLQDLLEVMNKKASLTMITPKELETDFRKILYEIKKDVIHVTRDNLIIYLPDEETRKKLTSSSSKGFENISSRKPTPESMSRPSSTSSGITKKAKVGTNSKLKKNQLVSKEVESKATAKQDDRQKVSQEGRTSANTTQNFFNPVQNILAQNMTNQSMLNQGNVRNNLSFSPSMLQASNTASPSFANFNPSNNIYSNLNRNSALSNRNNPMQGVFNPNIATPSPSNLNLISQSLGAMMNNNRSTPPFPNTTITAQNQTRNIPNTGTGRPVVNNQNQNKTNHHEWKGVFDLNDVRLTATVISTKPIFKDKNEIPLKAVITNEKLKSTLSNFGRSLKGENDKFKISFDTNTLVVAMSQKNTIFFGDCDFREQRFFAFFSPAGSHQMTGIACSEEDVNKLEKEIEKIRAVPSPPNTSQQASLNPPQNPSQFYQFGNMNFFQGANQQQQQLQTPTAPTTTNLHPQILQMLARTQQHQQQNSQNNKK